MARHRLVAGIHNIVPRVHTQPPARRRDNRNEDRFIVAEKPTSKWFVRVYLFVYIIIS